MVYQDAGAFVAGPAALTPVASTGNPAIEPGTSFYIKGYSGGAQTAWLERTLAAGRRDDSVDWIVVQMHQCACSSSATGNGSDLGIRQQWLPLFDRYEVDLVLNGHDHDYERSFPVRGADANVGHEVATGAVVNTLRPHPVTTTDNGVFDTSQGTVHLILGCGGTDANLDDYGTDTADGSSAKRRCSRRPTARCRPPRPMSSPGRGPTRSRTPAGRPSATPRPATGSRCSTSTPTPRTSAVTPASPSPSTTRWARTRSTRPPASRAHRPPTTPSSRPSP